MSGSVPFTCAPHTCALLAMHHISARHSPVHQAPYIIYTHRTPVNHTLTTSHLYIGHLCRLSAHLCTAHRYIAHLCTGPRLHRVSPYICRAPRLCTWPQFVPIYLTSLTLCRLSGHLCTAHRYIAHLCAGPRLHRVGPCICRAPCPCTWPQFAPIYLTPLTLPGLAGHLAAARCYACALLRDAK